MAFPLDGSSITHGIQLAVAPVFLLTAVSGMIGAVAGRLARAARELQQLRVRGMLANGSIALLTSCALLIGVTIIVLFLGETSGIQISRWAITCFLLGVACFLAALLCFLAETFLATRLLDFRVHPHGAGPPA